MQLKISLLLAALFTGMQLPAQNRPAAIDSIISREMKERSIPGVQIAIVQHGKIVLSKSYGTAHIQNNIPVTGNSVFPINSCTKVFTAVAVMQLVEEGKIKLSDPVAAYVDSLPAPWQQVTVAQLLTHTSGIPDILKLFDPQTGGVGALRNEGAIWAKLKTLPMDFRPGGQFSYNQTNGYLLGKIIRKLSGQPFDEFFKEKQFRVAGMQQTIFGDSRDVIPLYAPTYHYRKNQDGRKLPQEKLEMGYHEFPEFTRTGAGLNSTAEDMARWIICLQTGKLLKNTSSLDTLWSRSTLSNGTPAQWSMGWGMAKWRSKHKAIGMNGGGRNAFLVYPDDDLAVIVLTNLGGSSPEDYLEELAACYIPGIIQNDLVTLLRTNLRTTGYDNAIAVTDAAMKSNPSLTPNENELNEWAYRMMSKGQLREALAVFRLNVHLFPNSWNVYDSYGEALLADGKKEEALQHYRKSIALNPGNEHGKKMIAEIMGK